MSSNSSSSRLSPETQAAPESTLRSPAWALSLWGALLTAALLALVAACGGKADAAPAPAPAAVAGPSVRHAAARVVFAPPRAATQMTVLTLPAELVLPPVAAGTLSPPLAGKLRAWRVGRGEQVVVGTPLADLDSPGQASRASLLRELAADVAARRRLLASQRPLVKQGLISAQELQSHELALTSARQRLRSAKEQRAARDALGAKRDGVWVSPVAGVVSDVQCPVGAMVTSEMTCITIIDITQAELVVQMPERALSIGADVINARFTPAAAPDQPREYLLVRKAAQIDRQSRAQTWFFKPGDGSADGARFLLAPGSSGRVDIVSKAPAQAWVVPDSALTRLDGQDVVFVIDVADPGTVPTGRPLVVRVLGRAPHGKVVSGDGLDASASIAVDGVFLLKSLWVLR